MTNLCEILEAFCWRCKIHEIWKPNPSSSDDILRRMHSEAAVFNAVYRCKNSTVPTEEKINQTIKFLEENEFWRTNSLSLFANHKDPGVIRVVKILQKQEVRDIWNGEVPSKHAKNSKEQSNQNGQTSANNTEEWKKSITNDKVETDGSVEVDEQKSDVVTSTNNGTNMSCYLHNSQLRNTSLVPENMAKASITSCGAGEIRTHAGKLQWIGLEGLGLCYHTKATLKPMPNAQPAFHPKRAVPLAIFPMVDEELKDLEQRGVLKSDPDSK
ncbi:hypothetical protein ACTXT7_016991 [Hymenolepis weldensis]